MGRLEVRHGDVYIRHGHGGGGNGPVIALIALVMLAAAGGAAHKTVSHVMHVVTAVLEVAAWTVAAAVMAAVAGGLVLAGLKIRAAVHASRARRAAIPAVITVTPDSLPHPAAKERPALDASRSPADSWPWLGQPDQIRPSAGDDDDRRHYS